MQDLDALEGKTLPELREIGKVLGITDTTLKKRDLLKKITEFANADAPAEPVSVEPASVEPASAEPAAGLKFSL